jgi:xanthine dehydrogenase accessory factor
VKYPAGLDLGGMSAAEIALSVLAEIVQRRYGKAGAMKAPAPPTAEPVSLGRRSASTPSPAAFPVDPVCGMPVDPATARHTLVDGDRTIYFCCPHCKAAYVRRQAESTA